MNLKELNKLSNEELITEVRKRDFEIGKLKKQMKTISDKWRNYYRIKAYHKDKKVKALT